MQILVVLLPLISSIIAGFLKDKPAQIITIAGVFITAALSGMIFYDTAVLGNSYNQTIYQWIQSGDFSADIAVKIDVLTAVMMVVVSWISAAVHLYAVGYMSHYSHKARFMSYLSLFTFFMMVLITSNNFVQLFLGWEGVGLSSYLLIGFWTHKATANSASMKAFLMNRVADCGFLLAIFLIYKVYGAVDFATVFAGETGKTVSFLGKEFNAVTLISFLLFFGCMGKSAQIGLHSWLPDAMEGPTPVSALLHSATMVTAGVFLVARCSPLLEYAGVVREAIIVIASITCLFGGLHAMVKNDIKKVIAYSTISQLGYMFIACGIGAYGAGIFHLFTHAFFKALLFLCAGSVIHAVHTQDMRQMGGLWKKIPYTYTAMWIGTLAIIGIPPLSAYYSKDLILETAFVSEASFGKFGYISGTIAVFMSAFYSLRLMLLTFHNKKDREEEIIHHDNKNILLPLDEIMTENTPKLQKGNLAEEQEHKKPEEIKESPVIMLLPIFALSILAVVAGMIGYHFLGMGTEKFWAGSIFIKEENTVLEDAHHVPLMIKYLPLVLTIIGGMFAYLKSKNKLPDIGTFDIYEALTSFAEKFSRKNSQSSPSMKNLDIYEVVASFGDNLRSKDKTDSRKNIHNLDIYEVIASFGDKFRKNKKVHNEKPDIYMVCSKLSMGFGKVIFHSFEAFFNKIYDVLIAIGVYLFGRYIWRIWDMMLIDGSISKGISNFSLKAASRVSRIQSGYIISYAFVMILGVVTLMGWGIIVLLKDNF